MARRSFLDRLRGQTVVDDDIVVDLDDADVPVLDRNQSGEAAAPPDRLLRTVSTTKPMWPIRQLHPPAGMDRDDYLAALAVLADRLCRTLSADHRVEHVALWRMEGTTYAIVGAAGLTSAWRRHRIPRAHPAVRHVAMTDGILVEDVQGRNVHVLGLPGVRTSMYGLAMVDREPLVDLVTASGMELDEATMAEIVASVTDEVAVWAGVRRPEHLKVLVGDD